MPRFLQWTTFLGLAYLVACALLVHVILSLWPPNGTLRGVHATLCGVHVYAGAERQLLAITLAFGALGSYIHSTTSFATYVGNKTIERSWMWWYVLRPTIGIAIALILYMMLRGGLLTASAGVQTINIYGTSAIAGLAGMFSKQATDKMSEVFETLFRTASGQGDAERKDKLEGESQA